MPNQQKKDDLFKKNFAEITRYIADVIERKKLDTDLKTFTKINLKCVIYHNVKCKIIKLLEENPRENLWDLGLLMGF